MKMFKYHLLVLASILALMVCSYPSWLLTPLLWIFIAVSIVALAYVTNQPSIFRKRATGKVPLLIKLILLPYLGAVWCYNWLIRIQKAHVNCTQLSDQLFVASRLLPTDVAMLQAEGIVAILDVTAEYDGFNWQTEDAGFYYLSIPILDHHSPSKQQIAQALSWIAVHHAEGRKVVVHCALGRGRSVLVCAAFLLATQQVASATDAMAQIRAKRQRARLNRRQLARLEHWHQHGELEHKELAVLVVNPVAGGGKWLQYENDILGYLTQRYQLAIYQTEADKSIQCCALQALQASEPALVVAGGGDGTLAAVADVVMGHQAKFGILPLGTANSLAHAFHGSVSKIDPILFACRTLVSGQSQWIDTVSCNGKSMLLMAAVGIAEQMLSQANRERKNEHGQVAYMQSFMDAVLDNHQVELTVIADDKPAQTLCCASCVVANAAPWSTILAQGGESTPDWQDGKMDVTVIHHQTQVSEYWSVAQTLMSNQDCTALDSFQCQRLRLLFSQPIRYALDGEVFESEQLEFQIKPQSLLVMMPN
ncbi:diacylglycerol kinase family protein [Pseudoalteromonas fenneropenaei]|uniref:Diacylglycerol kinase family protein n=1 Tax=Pseudoalteromonas fenneropenaei TaxID=1737459 RepID=A0ABV7CNT8_9GAMM